MVSPKSQKAPRPYGLLFLSAGVFIYLLYVFGRIFYDSHVAGPRRDAEVNEKIAEMKREGKARDAHLSREAHNCIDRGGTPVMTFTEWHVICVDRKAVIDVYEETEAGTQAQK